MQPTSPFAAGRPAFAHHDTRAIAFVRRSDKRQQNVRPKDVSDAIAQFEQ
jgi:hypothetical protein